MSDKAYRLLREALLRGDFAPGQGISLRGAADALGVSEMPVRQALSRLHAEGALVAGDGGMLAVPQLTERTAVEIRDVRIALEGLAAARAAELATDADVAVVAARLAPLEAAVRAADMRAYLVANRDFHFGIYDIAKTELLVPIIDQLWVRYSAYTRLDTPEDVAGTLRNHHDMLKGMQRRDAVLVRAAVVQDCCDSCEILLRILAEARAVANAGVFDGVARPMLRRRGRPPKR